MTILQIIGYWDDSEDPMVKVETPNGFPHPRELVEPGWDGGLKKRIVNYLNCAPMHRGSWGHAYCRMDPSRDCEEMGSREMTDGTYIWPEGLKVYVEDYDVRLPAAFLEHMKALDFKVPPVDRFLKAEVDDSFWREWCEEQLGRSFARKAR